MGTALYRSVLAFDYNDAERAQLMREVWSPTPWMVEAYTGCTGGDRTREIIAWCRDRFGPESSPIHERAGQWQRGGATVNGWTWFGFATEEQMQEFEKMWPTPAEAAA